MYIIVSFLILSLCLVVEGNHFLLKHFPAKKGGVNKEGRKIGLRKTADQSLPTIEWLPAGAFAPVKFEGERWVYILYKNLKYAIPKSRFSLGYSNLYGLLVVPTSRYQHYRGWMSRHIRWFHFGLGFSLLSWLIVRRKKKSAATKPTSADAPIIGHRPLIGSIPPDKTIYVNSPVQSQTDFQQEDLKQRLINELYESKIFLEALNAEYEGTIEKMEIAAEKMREEFERMKNDALILGVDLDSPQLAALVKGRQFEIFAAKIWDADSRATIQSWTPDKGIHEGIYIKSNGDPDFLLELKTQAGCERQLMAIECKYRSIYTDPRNDEQIINWIKYYQYKRYEEYRERTGRNVYILLGADGDPRSPDHLYFAPMSALRNKSEYDEREDFKNLYATVKSFEPFEVTASTMMDSIFSCFPK
jgi:hypothetical protein